MLEGMGIHFNDSRIDDRMHDGSRALTTRLYPSSTPQTESFENELLRNGQSLDADLLRVGLPPLPPVNSWLIEPENRSESKPKNRSEDIKQTLEVDDFDSVIDGSANEDFAADSNVKSAAKQRTIPRLVFKPTQAVVVILVLVVALCASLTMLVTQTINYNKQQAEASSVSATVASGSKAKGSGLTQGNSSKSGGAAGSTSTSAGAGGQNTGSDAAATQANSPAQADSSAGQAGTSSNGSNLINLNTADSTQLQQIKGVGPVMAQKIIDYRTSIGHFTSVDQLLKVSGIGQKTLEKIRGQVTV
ncbi:helix-hairpin-helix domain-containing protein [Bifidobacterium sp. ESL0690]|uniref:helix-hairpin-helix domain-containing protein n=1 Tax=Bifidobacterium sp. ESL0690 TaxID=2983214 RepID=UPI0023F8150A|nr:helix-hairpin-helix domain-containing protein [Bifidobacterium sp. ESL0690]WEV45929.1 helix-hairpin-helix domain-containing protein [Bifidobacterium sp. ESL0690]